VNFLTATMAPVALLGVPDRAASKAAPDAEQRTGPATDDLEPTLMRHGYRQKDLVKQFDAKPAKIRALFNNALDARRATQLRNNMLRAGLPL
jgi:hypothetical protein